MTIGIESKVLLNIPHLIDQFLFE